MTDEPNVYWHQVPCITILDEVHVILDGRELDLKRFWTTHFLDEKSKIASLRHIYIELEEKEKAE